MANVRFGGGVSEIRGSIAGTVFSRNASGAYAKARVKPVNPQTSLQDIIRSIMGTLTNLWSGTLTAAQRAAWELYASNVSMLNRLGESIFLSGFNHYIRSNANLLQAGEPPVNDGPAVFSLPAQDSTLAVTGSEAAVALSVTYDNTMPWANEVGGFMFFFQGRPQNPQRNFFGGPWRHMFTLAGDPVPPVSPQVISPLPWVITELQHQWIYVRVCRADGRLSEPFRDETFITA